MEEKACCFVNTVWKIPFLDYRLNRKCLSHAPHKQQEKIIPASDNQTFNPKANDDLLQPTMLVFFFTPVLTQDSQVSPLFLLKFPVNGICSGLKYLCSCIELQNFPLQQHSKLPFTFKCFPPCRPIKAEARRARITGKAFEGSRPSICFAGRLPFKHLCKNGSNWAHSVGLSAI